MKAIARGLWFATILLTVAITACSSTDRDLDDGLYAEIVTSRGEIVVRLAPERAPMTVMNFVGLAEGTIDNDHADGKPFYDGLTFHRVEPGFVIQGGDPAGNGTGGPGYQFPTETHPELKHDKPGVVAMANSGPDTNGSQFYITMAPTPHLDGGYNVFGEVIEGMDVVGSIEVGDRIREVKILRYGESASSYRADEQEFRALVDAALQGRVEAAARRQEDALEEARDRWPDIREVGTTGVLVSSLREGSGDPPQQGDRISVHIVFSLLDGTQLDSTVDRGEPQQVTYLQDRLIRGLEIAVGTLRVGGRAVAIVPPELAFGEAGLPPVVPPNSHVVFEVERLE